MCTYPVQTVCTSLSSLLFILLFIKSHRLFLHILLVLHFSLFYCTFYSLFLFFTYIYALVLCYFYLIFILLHCPLSGPDLIYISLLIIPCIIYYVTNKETLNFGPWTLICVELFWGDRNVHCYASCTLTTLHLSKVSFLQCCHMKRYNKIFTKMWGVYSLLWDTVNKGDLILYSVTPG